jgi:TonB family protein
MTVRLSAGWGLAILVACGAPSRESRPAPGEEPIETASLSDEEVVPLEPESAPRRAPASQRPCSWAEAWSDPATPDPLLAGIGGAPVPERIDSNPVRLPARPGGAAGEISVEIVVLPDGTVSEATVVSRTEPSWPEGERAILDAVATWRYRPPTLGGTPIAVCMTVSIAS